MDAKTGTTAHYRKIAAMCEDACDWRSAAKFWTKALDAYPLVGALAERDKERITARLEACKGMAA